MDDHRVVAYARVSSKEQADKELSIPAQLKAIRKFCEDKGWKLVGEYIDEGKSAKTADRPEFQKMIALSKKPNRHFDAIIVHKYDRFSRNREDHVIYKALLRKHGVNVVSVTEQTDPETPHGFLLEGMLEVISEFYNMNLRNETLKGMKENAHRGYHNGGFTPYGYKPATTVDNRGNSKTTWEPNPDEADVVRDIYDMYVNRNMGYKAIAYELNKRGIPTRSGKSWSYSSIWHILHNEAYIGKLIWNKRDYVSGGVKRRSPSEWIVTANAHPPLVSRDLFNAVKQRSEDRANNTQAVKKAARMSPFILRGILLCPDCGQRMVTGSNSLKSRGYTRYYHCGTHHRKGPVSCNRNATPKDKIETQVLNSLVNDLGSLADLAVLQAEIEHYAQKVNAEGLREITETEGSIKYIERRLAQLRQTQSEDDQSVKAMLTEQNNLKAHVERLRRSLWKAQYTNEELTVVSDRLQDVARKIKFETPDVQWLRLKQYVPSIRLDKTTGNYRMKVVIMGPDGNSPIAERTCYFANPHERQ